MRRSITKAELLEGLEIGSRGLGEEINGPSNTFFSGVLKKLQCQQLQTDFSISEMYSSNEIHKQTYRMILSGHFFNYC